MNDDRSDESEEARAAPRAQIRAQADLREAGGGSRYKIDMIDISISGFRFESANSIRTGLRGFVTLPGMQGLECVVAWEKNWIHGARFVQPLHPSVRDHIAARFPR